MNAENHSSSSSDASHGSQSSQFGLLRARRFAPFFGTQFFGAFNDNLFKNALVVLVAFHAAEWSAMAPEVLTNLAAAIFILPFFLFSATAGQLADKYDKARIARAVKILEMLIMVVAGIGFLLHSLVWLFVALCLLGLHSTVFGPVKYAILPQHLSASELVGGNALVEAGTFIAILLGTIVGGLLAKTASPATGGHPVWIAVIGLAIAAAGYLLSRGIPAAPPPAPELRVNPNPLTETWRNLGFARRNRKVFLAILGISWFWLYGALFLTQFPVYTQKVLGGDETVVTLLLATFSVGIGVGSLLCERLSAKRLEIGLVPFGSIGLTLFALDLSLASALLPPAPPPEALHGVGAMLAQFSTWRILADLVLIGLFGGFFIVPLYALVQLESAEEHRARIIAANNIMNAVFMVGGALFAAGILGIGASIPLLFAIGALFNAAIALYIYRLVPEFLLRFIAWMLVHTVYRLSTRRLEHLPERGAALLVCNHVSRVDPFVLMAASGRPIRFVLGPRLLSLPVLGYVLRRCNAIALPAEENGEGGAEGRARAYDAAARALDAGHLVAVFPEGKMTEDGGLGVFDDSARAILVRLEALCAENGTANETANGMANEAVKGTAKEAADAAVRGEMPPVLPLALNGMWGSLFSRRPLQTTGRADFGLLGHLFARVTIAAAAPLAFDEADGVRLRAAVAGLIDVEIDVESDVKTE